MNRLLHRTGIAPLLGALLALTALVYGQGLSGPFLFDDTTNILKNTPLQVESLAPAELWRAAWSLESGPLKRPLAYLTFALNHYFAGGYEAFSFKTTNLAIHLLNVLLVAALARRLAGAVWPQDDPLRTRTALLAAAAFALHPLALSPVLYVVQRMASLSTLFVLAALLCALRARQALEGVLPPRSAGAGLAGESAGRDRGALLQTGVWAAGAALFALLGLFTKENAALLVLLYPLADRVLWPQAPYWRWLGRPGVRLVLWLAVAAGVALLAWKVAPGYALRPFTLLERQLTEARVLWFYLGLFALPRIDAFGLYHDDIALSTGLLAPWTTLPALLGIAGLMWLGFRLLRRAPLAGLAILWFFAAHLMESSLIPLEIAHEHRNYLPMVGLCVGAGWGLTALITRLPRRAGVAALTVVFGVLGATTALRAWEWGEADRFYHYQVEHHPDSAHSRNDYASELAKRRRYADALEQLRAAQRAAPHEAGYYFNYTLTARTAGLPVPDEVQTELGALLQSRPLSAFGQRALETQGECLRKICNFMAADMQRWLTAYISAPVERRDTSQLEYLLGLAYVQLGQVGPALNAFERAHALDADYLHPLFEQANLFMALGQWDNAEFNLQRLTEANRTAPVRQDKALAELTAAIAEGRERAPALRILENASTTPGESP
jgi:tetratricopeptide (TPR) repeat protein